MQSTTHSVTKSAWIGWVGWGAGVMVTLAFLVAHVSADESRRVLFDNIQWSMADGSAAWLAWCGYRCAGSLDQAARRWFAWGLGSYAVGQLLWDAQVWLHWSPFPGPADLFYAACGPLVAYGIWQSARQRVVVPRVRPMLLNFAILWLQAITLVLVWYLPQVELGWLPLLQLCVYPVVLFGCVIMAVVMALELNLRPHWRWLLLPASLLMTGVAWMQWNILDYAGTPASGSWLNYSFAIASVLHGFGAAHWNIQPALSTRPPRASARILVLLPVIMVMVAVVTVWLVWMNTQLSNATRVAVLLSAAVVIVLSVLRQNFWVAERDHLLRLERQQVEQEQQFRVLAQRLELAAEAAGMGVWELQIDTGQGVWDARMYALYGQDPHCGATPAEIWQQCVSLEDRRLAQEKMQQACATHERYQLEFCAILPNGQLRYLEAYGYAQYDAGRPARVIGITWDITDAVLARRALAESEAELRAIFDNAVVGIALIDQNRHPLRTNKAVREFMGYDIASSLQVAAQDVLHPDDDPDSRAQFAALKAGNISSYQAERRYRRGDGVYRWVRVSVYPVQLNNADCFVVMIEDIEERKRMEMALQEARERQLRMHEEFAYKLLDVQEQERQRLANELHDGLGQSLSIIKNRAQLAVENAVAGSAIAVQLQGILNVTVDAISEARGLAHNLRPLHIEQLGLTSALQRLLEQFQQAHRVQMNAHLDAMDDAFKAEQVTHIYRLLQEALNNIAKHARATQVEVNGERDLHVVRLTVHDNGVGFDVVDGAVVGLGLTSMTERTHMLGGQIQFESRSGQGTWVRIELPVCEP